MAYSLGSYTSGETSAYNADCPIIVALNDSTSAVDARWTTTGTQAGTDLTLATAPADNAYDGRGVDATSISTTGVGTVYFNIQIAAATLDTCAMIFTQSYPSSTVTVQIADDAGFTTNVATFAGPFTTETGSRIVRTFSGNRYSSVEYIRIRFVKDSGTYAASEFPQLGEFVLGNGRIFSLRWGYGSDEQPNRSSSSDFEAKSADISRYTYHYGRKIFDHSQVWSTVGRYGLDDVDTIRTIYSESSGGTGSVFYIPNPTSAVATSYLGYIDAGGLDMPREDFGAYDWSFRFREVPPLQSLEA